MIKISSQKWILAILSFILGVVTLLWWHYNSQTINGVLYPLLFSFVCAYLLNQPVKKLEQKIGNRNNAVIIVFSLTIVTILLVLFITLPILINDLTRMVTGLPRQMQEFQVAIDKINQLASKISPEYSNLSHTILQKATEYWQTLVWEIFIKLTSDFENLLKKLTIIIYVPILIFFILKDFEKLKKAIKINLPRSKTAKISYLKRRLNTIFFGWIKGQIIICSIIVVLIYLGLMFIGLEQKLFLALFSGFTNLIPYFGPVIGLLPAVATAFSQDSSMVFKVILLYTLTQQIESNIISPKIFGDRVGLSPAWILIALIVGGKVGGILGLILAVPLAGIIKAVLEYFGGRKIRYISEEELL